ncbi:MAG: MFS transporter [Desulfarculaceae bacterium]|nr:MFS transporter [Desulfarculaceae bacterium]MCF8072913.1 MFS transporter [Desulfarculaceae bacterium]MCF8101081.1 MFS transporter [Desulfarculaceae bacterium]MCF8115532.1 MFS transporter [Desulfarculaceae bacterium]
MSKRGYPPPLLSWLVWGLGALFYLMGFFQRVSPGVITHELMSEFSLSAAALGNLSAYYFYAYVAMQIPTGVIADHWGPRRLLSAGAVVAGAGALLFGLSPSLGWAEAGRLLVGGSVAVAWVALLKLASHWFAPRRFAMVSGMALLIGLVGAVGAGLPLRLMVDAFGWRPVMAASGLVTLGIAAAVWLFIRNDPSERGYLSFAAGAKEGPASQGILSGLVHIWRYSNTWFLFAAPGGIVGPVLTFAGLWGVPYLRARYGLSPASGAVICSLLLVGWGLGGPLFGGLSDRLGRRKPLYLFGAALSLAGWLAVLFLPGLPLWAFVGVMLSIGLASGGVIVCFAWAKESVPLSLGGTVSGTINMGFMLGPTLLQPLVGWVLDTHWQGAMEGGARIYGLEAYQAGFIPMIAWAGLALLLGALVRETHCAQAA